MLQIAICDDSRADVETLEKILNQFQQYPITYNVFFSVEEIIKQNTYKI